MKKKYGSLFLAGCLATMATTGFADQVTQTAQFTAPVDVDSCFITPILNFAGDVEQIGAWYSSDSSSAKALARAVGYIGAMVGGNVELSITHSGNDGPVNEIYLNGNMRNGHFALMNVEAAASSEADVSASVRAYLNAWRSAWANSSSGSYSYFSTPLGWSSLGFMAGAYGSSHAYSHSYASSYGYAYAESDAESNAAAEAYAVSDSSNVSNMRVSVKGTDIKEFKGLLNLDGYSFTYLRTETIADVLVEAYARTYAQAYAQAYARAQTSTNSSIQTCTSIWGWSWCYTLDNDYDYDYAYQSAYNSLINSDELFAIAEAHAEAVAAALATSRLRVNLGVLYKNLPGSADLLVATGNSNASVNCYSYTDADADALVEVQ